jgi:hypothetical protein
MTRYSLTLLIWRLIIIFYFAFERPMKKSSKKVKKAQKRSKKLKKFELTNPCLKGHQYGYQMKGLDQGNKILFTFRFLCLFTFHQHKQLPMVAQFFKVCVAGGYAAKGGRNGPYFFNWF